MWLGTLSATGAVLLSENNQLQLVIASKNTSTSDSAKDVGTGTLEQGLGSLVLQYLREGVQRALVLDSFTGGHHHSSSDSVDGIRSKASTIGDQPTKGKTCKETILQAL